ncbi:hypothetical protein ACFWDI_26235 [Streptomyces sp. NPDC060064]|uniref:hypothetical protein n=1 Tax=Streptomyces sp. NPDC060064 TaxID=3347049 RepID=UPI0036C6D3BC
MLTKSVADVAVILAAYDLTRCAFSAAKLAGCDPKTVRKYVARREAGVARGPARRAQMIDHFRPKIEELVDHSKGSIRANVVHQRLVAMGFTGTERTTRRAVAEVKAAWMDGHARRDQPWVPEPGMWLQVDWGEGPTVAGRRTQLFCAWLSWSKFRVLLPAWDRTSVTMVTCLDATFRRIGGVPSYVLTKTLGTEAINQAAEIAVEHAQLMAAGTHYGCTVATCEPSGPQDMGGVETTVKIAEADLVPTTAGLLDEYCSFAGLAAACDAWCEQVNARPHPSTQTAPMQQLATESDHLHPVPATPYYLVLGDERVVDDDQTVDFAAARYQTPPGLAGSRVWCRIIDDELAITAMTSEGLKEITRHRRYAPVGSPVVDGRRSHRLNGVDGHLPPPRPHTAQDITFLGPDGAAHHKSSHHRASHTTTGWSHEPDAPLERLLCARLSVFAGGFDLSAAQAVCSGGPLSPEKIPILLDGLVAKSVVWQPDGPNPLRYGMHDTAREHGAQWLKDFGESRSTRRQHVDCYLKLVHLAEAEWMGPNQVYWCARLVAEHANLRAALDFCLAEGDGNRALEMGGALWFFWFACGYAREGRHYLERALDLWQETDPRRSTDPRLAKALWACGITALQQGDSRASTRLGALLRRAAHDCRSQETLGAAAYLQGSSLRLRGAPSRAAEVFATASGSPRREGPYEAAWLLVQLARALAHAHRGETGHALTIGQKLRAHCAERGDQWMSGWADYARAVATLRSGRPDEAAALARSAVEGAAQLNDSFGCAVALDLKARAIAAVGRGKHAAHLLGLGEQVWRTLGRPQLGMPELVAARVATELRIRQHIGDTAYETEYRAALERDTNTGIALCLANGAQ